MFEWIFVKIHCFENLLKTPFMVLADFDQDINCT